MVVPEMIDLTAVHLAAGWLFLLFRRKYEEDAENGSDDDDDDEEFVLKRLVGGEGEATFCIICCLWRFPIDFRIDLMQINRRDWGFEIKGAISARNFLNKGPLIFGATPNSTIVVSMYCLILIGYCWLSIAVHNI